MKKILMLFLFMAMLQSARSQFVTSGAYTYNNTTLVGIGTATPAQRLEVVAKPGVTIAAGFRGDSLPIIVNVYANSSLSAFHHPGISLMRARGTNLAKSNVLPGDRIGVLAAAEWLNSNYQTSAAIEFYAGALASNLNYSANIRFATIASGTGARVERMRIAEDGSVGIGVSAPLAKLDILGNVKIADGTQGLGKVLTSDANGLAVWAAPTGGGWGLLGNAGTVDGTNFLGTTDNIPLTIKVNNQKSGRIDHLSSSAFFGYRAGIATTAGTTCNNAFGTDALFTNSSGNHNNAFGYHSMNLNTIGSLNSSFGNDALSANNAGNNNAAFGAGAGDLNTSGSFNTYLGSGTDGNSTGTYNTLVGAGANTFTTATTNATAIGANAQTTASNQVRVGNTSVTSIGGYVGWSNISDGRFKTNVKEDVSGLDFIIKLRPVSYLLDYNAIDRFTTVGGSKTNIQSDIAKMRGTPTTQTGFIAQEVEAIVKQGGFKFSGVEAPQNDKDHYSLRYAEFVVPLVKAVQELSKKITDQQAMIDMLTAKLGESSASKLSTDAGVVLSQNVPNPFTTDTEIKMSIPDAIHSAVIIVYNLQGAQLKSIPVPARGETSIRITAGELSAGMYLYTLIADGNVVDTKRMILIK